jgi:hypothetical protein
MQLIKLEGFLKTKFFVKSAYNNLKGGSATSKREKAR